MSVFVPVSINISIGPDAGGSPNLDTGPIVGAGRSVGTGPNITQAFPQI